MSRIQFVDVYKNFDKTEVLKDISFEVDEGEMVSLVGPSGSGKTTILRIIAGLIDKTKGQVLIDGRDASLMSERERGTVIVYQDYALFPHMTVAENIAFGLKVRKVSSALQNNKVKELMTMLHMEGYENRYPRELSGGQKQRVALARALAIEPNVLLLDEPFSSLDTHLRNSMRDLIKELQRKLGITTILVTHDIEEALMVSDRIAVLLNGQIAQFDRPESIYNKPTKKIIVDFLGGNAVFASRIDSGQLVTPFGRLTSKKNYTGDVEVVFRQEAASIVSKEDSSYIGKIIDRIYTGKSVLYKVETDLMKFELVEEADTAYEIGQEVAVHIDLSKLLIFRKDTGEAL